MMKSERTISFVLVITLVLSMGLVVLASPSQVLAAGTTYYVDSVNGLDTNNGTSTGTAWQTLAKVSSVVFQPGDHILFKAGCSWTGALILQGSGSATGGAIVIDMYGWSSGMSKPILNGNGALRTIHLQNVEYWEINNLEVTNNPATPGDVRAIFVQTWNGGLKRHLYFRNLYVHDVNADLAAARIGGFIFMAEGSGTPSMFDDVRIENCSLYNVCRAGISLSGGSWCDRNFGEFYPSTNIVVRNNYLNEIGGDGIVIMNSQGALTEYNVANRCASKSNDAHVAMWPFKSSNATFQYNEAYNTVKVGSLSYDSQGYDCDYMDDGTLFQYNYSHNNQGGFIVMCCNSSTQGAFNIHPIVRYNVSENDGLHAMRIAGGTTDAEIYNNTIYIGASAGNNRVISFQAQGGVFPTNTSIKNNIIYNLGTGVYLDGGSTNTVYDYNCFYGNHPSSEPADVHKITADPMLVSPGNGGTIVAMIDPDTMKNPTVFPQTNLSNPNRLPAYKLQAGSPCIDAGVVIADNGGKDYWGTSLYNGAPDIGACEYVGTVPTATPTATPTPTAGPVVYEAETLPATITVGRTHTNTADVNCSGGAFDNDNLNDIGKYIEYTLSVPTAGTYNVKVKYVGNTSRGIWQMKVNGVNQGSTVDGYSSKTSYTEVDLGNVTFATAGDHLFRFESTGKNGSSISYRVCADAITLTKQ